MVPIYGYTMVGQYMLTWKCFSTAEQYDNNDISNTKFTDSKECGSFLNMQMERQTGTGQKKTERQHTNQRMWHYIYSLVSSCPSLFLFQAVLMEECSKVASPSSDHLQEGEKATDYCHSCSISHPEVGSWYMVPQKSVPGWVRSGPALGLQFREQSVMGKTRFGGRVLSDSWADHLINSKRNDGSKYKAMEDKNV